MIVIPAIPAPEFKVTEWANSESISVKSKKGKVVLLDCWTYTCIFCLRTIPIMKRLKQKYEKYGLEVIQAHSKEYEFAAEIENIRRALAKYSIADIPVGFDTENKTWEAYGNSYWPKHVLIDSNGLIRYEHPGYGAIQEFEEVIVELLEEIGQKPSEEMEKENPSDEIYDTYGMHFQGIAPEICVGYSRIRGFGNNQKLKPDAANIVADSGQHQENIVYLRGKWIWQRESIKASIGGKEQNPAVIMKYNSAKRVHGIIGTADGKPSQAEIKIDGNFLTKEQAGKDVQIGSDGRSMINVEWPYMHNLVKTEKAEIHEIEIIPRTENFVFYTFVFG